MINCLVRALRKRRPSVSRRREGDVFTEKIICTLGAGCKADIDSICRPIGGWRAGLVSWPDLRNVPDRDVRAALLQATSSGQVIPAVWLPEGGSITTVENRSP